MSLDDLIDTITKPPRKERDSLTEVLRKLDEIERILNQLVNGSGSRASNYDRTCEELFGKLYTMSSTNITKTRPNLVAFEVTGGKYLVLHKDTYNYMKLIFEIYRNEDEILKHLDISHTTLFNILKREGLIYYDAEKKRYTFV